MVGGRKGGALSKIGKGGGKGCQSVTRSLTAKNLIFSIGPRSVEISPDVRADKSRMAALIRMLLAQLASPLCVGPSI